MKDSVTELLQKQISRKAFLAAGIGFTGTLLLKPKKINAMIFGSNPTIPGVSDHINLTNIGTNTHTQIDTHITDVTNPHFVTNAQVTTKYTPTGIEFGNTTQNYDITGTTWIPAVSGGALGGIPDESSSGHHLSDCINVINNARDSTHLAVREASGVATATNPLTVQFLFSSVNTFTSISFRSFYNGSASHTQEIQLWNYTTSMWDKYATFHGETEYVDRAIAVYDPTDYINAGVVKLQAIHTSYGNPDDYIKYDYVKLIDGASAGGTIETGFVRNTRESTLNVSNSAELQNAFRNLALAPSLLGDISIVLGAGTYADAVTLPSLISNGYKLIVSGGSTTQLTDTATGGSAGTRYVQGYVTQSGASYTVDVYKGMILKFTSGSNNGEYRVVERNSATQIDLIGQFLPFTPVNSDTFIIFDNDASITGQITINPTAVEINLTNINYNNLTSDGVNLLRFEECCQTITSYNDNKLSGSTIWYRNCCSNCSNDGVVGLWNFGSTVTMDSSLMTGNTGYTWGWLIQGGGHVLCRNGSVITGFDGQGIWGQIGGTAQMNPTSSYDTTKVTEVKIKKCGVGMLCEGGANILTDSVVFGIGADGNTTDKTPASASDPAWITN